MIEWELERAKETSVVPGRMTLWLAVTWALAGVAAAFWPALLGWWCLSGGVLLCLLAGDALAVRWQRLPRIERRLPGRFAVGQSAQVKVQVTNAGRWAVKVRWFDGIPAGAVAPMLPVTSVVPAGRRADQEHEVTVFRRGKVEFGPVHGRLASPMGFWWRCFRDGENVEARVYPDYAPVVRLALLAMDNRPEPMGIVKRPQAGVSREFHQLRDYREGDSLAQIDWKSTSRHRHLISREFEEQRNQTVVFLLDTGRRMRAMDGKLPQFDHCLNAALLGAYVALRQGDMVGVQGFGGTERWLPPVRGLHSMDDLLNHLYDYETTPLPGDFADAVEKLMMRQRRRALVVLLTNLRGEDGFEMLPALRVLRGKHLPLVASLREESVDELRQSRVNDFQGALAFGAAEGYSGERRHLLHRLGREGVLTVDATAADLPVALANKYLEIKRAARL